MRLPTTGGRFVVKRGKPVRVDEPKAADKPAPKKPAETKSATSEDET